MYFSYAMVLAKCQCDMHTIVHDAVIHTNHSEVPLSTIAYNLALEILVQPYGNYVKQVHDKN